jgi:hypothetical protein
MSYFELKNYFMKKVFLTLVISFVFSVGFSQNIGIGTTHPNSSAAIEIVDSAKGILIPRLTMVQRNAINNPAEGLMVYQTNEPKGFWYYDGAQWKNVTTTSSSNASGSYSQTLIYTTSGF